MVNATPQVAYFRQRNPVPIVQEAEWAQGPVWTGAENPASTEIRSPDRRTIANRYTDYATPDHLI